MLQYTRLMYRLKDKLYMVSLFCWKFYQVWLARLYLVFFCLKSMLFAAA